jgi:hypothetical protein
MKRRAMTGAEQDAFTRWRHLYCYLGRAGVVAGIKRQARRRERHEERARLRRSPDA